MPSPSSQLPKTASVPGSGVVTVPGCSVSVTDTLPWAVAARNVDTVGDAAIGRQKADIGQQLVVEVKGVGTGRHMCRESPGAEIGDGVKIGDERDGIR